MNQILTDTSNGFHTFTVHTWAVNLITPLPPVVWYFQWLYLGLVLLFLLAGIVLLFVRMNTEYKNRWLNFLFGNVAIGILLYFFRDQRLPYLGMDLLRGIHEIGILVWLNSVIFYYRTTYKKEQMQQIAIDRKSKYLPKAKK
jgi:hypothetical protein